MFKMRTDVDSMQLLDQKVFKMYEEHVKNSFQIFPRSKTVSKFFLGLKPMLLFFCKAICLSCL